MTRALVLLSLAVGCAGPPAALSAENRARENRPGEPLSIQGEWTSLDTLTQSGVIGDEAFEIQTVGTHLSVTDSVMTETTVSKMSADWMGGGLSAQEVALTYRVDGDSLYARSAPTSDAGSAHVAVRRDTLYLTYDDGAGGGARLRFVRSAPLGIAPEVLGFWAGLSQPDPAGMSAEIGFRFLPDGTYENGWGEAKGLFRVLGPYLLLSDGRTDADASGGARSPYGTAYEWRAEPAFDVGADQTRPALILRSGLDDDQAVLFRVDR